MKKYLLTMLAALILAPAFESAAQEPFPAAGPGPALKIRLVMIIDSQGAKVPRVDVLWGADAKGYTLTGATSVIGPYAPVSEAPNPLYSPGQLRFDPTQPTAQQYFRLQRSN